MAQAIAAAINSARARNRLSAQVTAVVRDTEVITDGLVSVTGIANAFISDIRDIAGNSLKPNRDNGSTAFTIVVGSGLDYGDAPAPYPTLLANNGARHQIVGDFFLGSSVDIDFDGQPNSDATGDDSNGVDDEDGVVVTQALTGGYGGAISVTASADGFLDAWIDFNRDGDWNDAGEQIFTRRALQQGANLLNVAVPGSASPGTTFARFRFSSQGGLAATGLAEDGEVEDYQIQLLANPWRNPSNGLDVDNSGFVVPLDALIVINDLNRNGPRALPNPPTAPLPPPFIDANGDTFATAQDVLVIVNFLNANSGGEGEGEGGMPAAAGGEGESSWLRGVDRGNALAATSDSVTGSVANVAFDASLLNPASLGSLGSTEFVDHRIATDGSADEWMAWGEELDRLDEPLVLAMATAGAYPEPSSVFEAEELDVGLELLLDRLADDVLHHS
jgi:hypothetical protein